MELMPVYYMTLFLYQLIQTEKLHLQSEGKAKMKAWGKAKRIDSDEWKWVW